MAKRGTTKFKSNIQEKQIAKDIGGKTVVASGALWSAKSDCRSSQLLVECKTTEKTFYSLTTKVWEKIRNEALKDGLRTPVMNIQLRDGKNSIAVIEYNDLVSLNMAQNDTQFVGNPVPTFVDAKSFRITPEFIYQDFPQEYKGIVYPRQDFKFFNVKTGSPIQQDRHLVLLDWNDFLKLYEEENLE